MTIEFSGFIPGSLSTTAVGLAGVLAELGVQQLKLTSPDGFSHDLTARATDLPGLMHTVAQGTVLSFASSQLLVRIDQDGLRWSVADPTFARAFDRISG